MVKKKVCLLGPFCVGKTSLIRKYIFNIYSEKYLSTVGVKIDKKTVTLKTGEEVMLMLWDLEGKEASESVTETYLRGMSGFILVADGTRPDTLVCVQKILNKMKNLFPGVPCILLINKFDLKDQWTVKKEDFSAFTSEGIDVSFTSAKDGTGVEEAFLKITEIMTR